MADQLTVDPAALRSAAARLSTLVQEVQSSPLAGQVMSSLLEAEAAMPGAQTGERLVDLGRAVSLVATEVVRAIEGLAGGLQAAADTYHRVDVVSGQAAADLGGGAAARVHL